METTRLRQFKAVVDSGGLIKAADVLGISPGGLSKSLKTLEHELGYKLFSPRGRGLELTMSGRELYERVPMVLKTLDELMGLKNLDVIADAPLRIVSFEVFTTYFLGYAAKKFLKHQAMDVREAIPGQMEQMVAEGKSDLGMTYLPIPYAGVEFVKMGRVRMGVYGLDSVFKGCETVDLPFAVPIAPAQGSPSGVQGLDGWPEHLFSRQVRYRVEMMESAIQLCRQGLAVAFLPQFIASLANSQAASHMQLVELGSPKGMRPVSRDIFLIQRPGFEETKTIRALAKALRSLE
jgi:DNA-binding transcriptional LysR family regulator